MMWSLTPQPLPCRRDTTAADTHHATAPGVSDDIAETQQRLFISRAFRCRLKILKTIIWRV